MSVDAAYDIETLDSADKALFMALNEELQVETGYIPSPLEQKIAFALSTPNINRTPSHICDALRISHNIYWKITLRKGFQIYLREILHRAMGVRMADILEASANNALLPNGFQDRKLLLQMTGYTTVDKQKAASEEKDKATASDIIMERLSILQKRNAPKEGDIVVG